MFITKTEKYNQYLEIIPSSDVLIGWHWTFVDCDILSLWCQGMVFPQAKLGTRGREEEKKTKNIQMAYMSRHSFYVRISELYSN